MALVEAPGALLLFQAAVDRLFAIYRNFNVGRHGVRDSISLAGSGRLPVARRDAVHGQPGLCTGRVLADPDPRRDSDDALGIDFADGGRAFGFVLGAGADLRMECGGARVVEVVDPYRCLPGPRSAEQIHCGGANPQLRDVSVSMETGAAPTALGRAVHRFGDFAAGVSAGDR